MIDFTNPQAASWWNRLMRPLYEQGVAFFKNDDGEYLPEDGRALIGMDGREYHNVYGFYYGKALFEGMADFQRRSLIYARSVWAGSQRYPALFLGDQKPTFSGIQSTLRAGLNLSLLGFSYWSADVFGLDGKTTPETHMRYAQWALLNPVARYFWRPPDLDDSRFPWSHGPAEEANFIKYVQLRYRLLPYFCWLAYQAWKTGLPIIRPLVMEFQDDTRLAEIDDQVFLGESLMLCPVVQAGVRSRKIRLPQGAWHDFWSSQSWQGPGEIDYPAPLDCLPLLVRGGTILPLGPELQFIPFEHRFDLLELHIWPPYPAEGWTFEEDGQTLAYQSGHASLTHFTASESQDRLVITIQAAQGAFPEQPEARQVTLVLHGRGVPQQVCLDGKPLQSWTFESQSRRLYLSFVCPVQRQTQIEIF
jgi:alpha-glucosidase (family GH31 glycosyl hydrolase)